MEPLVEIRNLSKSFPGVKALDNVRFDLRPGEIHALMGENGAGKSTLMKVMSGVYQRDTGEMKVDGKPVAFNGPRDAQDLGISIIHQELNLMNDLSAARNIFIGREPLRMRGCFIDEARMNREAEAIFRRLNLSIDPAVPVGQLTVASQQLVEIAKALSFKARVLIMDEPTAALNDREIEDLFRIIRDLRTQGVGIVYISHKMDEIRRISDRITVMRDGQYVATVPASETPIDEIIRLMVGRTLDKEVLERPDTTAAPVVLEVRNLNRGRAIRNVSFRARAGEIVGFAGLMGAGRTEVARAIFGADPLDSGEILMHGKTVTIRSPSDAVAQRIGYLSEDRKRFGLVTGMDVQTNVVMASLKKFLTGKFFLQHGRIRDTASEFVRRLAIKTPSVRQQVRLLSGGNQQKIVIAKWLERDCEVLFFDEPTRGIDIGAKREIYQLLDQLAAQGRVIVMISSELPEVLRLSHRVIVMCEGRITGELSAAEASQEAIMALATRREEAPVAAQPPGSPGGLHPVAA